MGQKPSTPTSFTLILEHFQEFKTSTQKDGFETKKEKLTTFCQQNGLVLIQAGQVKEVSTLTWWSLDGGGGIMTWA